MMYQANTFLNKYEQIWCIKCDMVFKLISQLKKHKIT